LLDTLREWLPRGNTLPDANWQQRHRGIVILLWVHAAIIPIFALVRGYGAAHVVTESLVLPFTAIFATSPAFSRRIRTFSASFGLLSASAILVHLSGGVIEMHFHFFVMVAVVSLYQDWIPFLTAIAYVFLHHAVLGSVDPHAVFNHPAAWNHPWRWAALHAFFIAGISVASLIAWKLNEGTLAAHAEVAGQLAILAEAGRVLTASMDVDRTLADLARLVTPQLADSCVVYLLNTDGQLEQAVAHADYALPDAADPRSETIDLNHPVHPVAQVARTGVSQFLDLIQPALIDASVDDRDYREMVRRVDPTSALVVPLAGRHEVIGALALGTIRSSGRLLTAADLALAEELARRAAVAVEHARLYAAQRDVAETLQHSLLPAELPIVPGVATAVRYVPGGPGVEVGGDWYDVLSFPDGTLGLVLGDVVGRGVPAASLMGQIRNALRAYALDEEDPSNVLRRLNALVHELGTSQSMATLVYGIFEPESSTLTLANAGHPPPLIIGGGDGSSGRRGEVSFVNGGLGPPLGAVLDPAFTTTTVTLGPGATLVMYTDGLVEDRVTPLDRGLEVMRDVVAAAPDDLEELCDHVLQGTLAGREAGDDAALVALRVAPVEEPLRLTLPARPNVVRALRTTLRRQLRNAGVSEQEEFEILVAVGEACANAIQHAGPASPTFYFDATIGDEVRVVVRDHGRWREPRPSNGGRGLSIMEQFMDRVDVHRTADGTEVILTRALSTVDATGSR
jgi:serine phosphatase RsbU (regulator of sigma subunit)/anti-sigma regulatory factor (Ser/Thr protein kinase)